MPASAAALPRRLAVIALVLAMLFTLAPAPPAEALSQATIRDRVYRLINKSRQYHGLRPLRVNRKVQYWAQRHARDMADAGTLFHDPSLGWELSKLSRTVWAYGENVAWTWDGRRAPRRIHRMFMRSPAHRANILRPRFTHMGVGIVKRNGKIYVVERFVDLRP